MRAHCLDVWPEGNGSALISSTWCRPGPEFLDHALDVLLGIGRPDRLTVSVVDSENVWRGRGALSIAVSDETIVVR
jgi:hypothetical protein